MHGVAAGLVPVSARIRRAVRAARDRARGQRGAARPPGSSGAAPATGCTAATPRTPSRAPEHGLEPVVLVPGFMAGDGTLGLMSRHLRGLGYRTYRSTMHANVGCTLEASEALERRIEAIALKRGPQGHHRRAQPRRPDGPRPRRPAPRPRRRHRHARQPDPRARVRPTRSCSSTCWCSSISSSKPVYPGAPQSLFQHRCRWPDPVKWSTANESRSLVGTGGSVAGWRLVAQR